jgi:hypothetical protein
MLKNFVKNRLAAMGRDLDYDTSYMQALLEADWTAFLRFSKLQAVSNYVRDVPLSVSYAVKLVGAMHEDCGPCSQLMITMAERAGVDSAMLSAVVKGDDAALDADHRLAVRYARAVLRREPEAITLRDEVVARWGQRGLVSLAFGLVSAKVFPTLKYALGYGRACSRLRVAGQPVAAQAAWAAEA